MADGRRPILRATSPMLMPSMKNLLDLKFASTRTVDHMSNSSPRNVVLLDPMHNIQPSDKHNYQVRATYIAQCAITKLSVTFEKLIVNCPHLTPDQQNEMLAVLREQNLIYFDAAVHMSISDGHLQKAYEFARLGAITDLGELLEATIDSLS
jgi:hypothetical protein